MASENPYDVLGVNRTASQDEIQSAYRRLAKKLHPDLNPGNRDAEQKFKETTVAYDVLRDPDTRARFDRGEIDASGAEQPQRRYYRDFAGAGMGGNTGAHTYQTGAGFEDFGDMDDILSTFFSQRQRGPTRRRGQDVLYHLTIDFLDAVNGATRTLTFSDGATLDVTIPPGVHDGQVLRLRGRGTPGTGDGPPGDALIEISVAPHPFFRRDGDNILIDLPISLAEAVLGKRIRVPTPAGPVMTKLKEWSNTGRVMRLRGKGVKRPDGTRGDELVTLKIVLPDQPDPDLTKFVSGWKAGEFHNPRASMGV